jgi:hypothetical protein
MAPPQELSRSSTTLLRRVCAATGRVVARMRSPSPTGTSWAPGYLPRRTVATVLAAIAPAFLMGAGAALAATAVAPAASPRPISEHQYRSGAVACVTTALDAPQSLEVAAVRVIAERPPAAWPPPAPAWQTTGTSPTSAGVPLSLNPASTSVVHWLGAKERLLAVDGSQREYLVTRSYEHVQLDHAGRLVSSHRGDLDSVVTVDTSTSSAIESRRGYR